jgi:hypothetical protein
MPDDLENREEIDIKEEIIIDENVPDASTDPAVDSVQEAYNTNPVVQTFDKSVPVVESPDYGNVVHQGGVTDMRTDNVEGQYDNTSGDYPTAPALDLHNSTHTEVAPDPGAGVPVPPDAAASPSIVEGKKDTVPNPDGNPMTLQEQIDKGVGTPSPNVETPGYVVPEGAPAGAPVVAAPVDDTTPGRDLTHAEQTIVDGTNNPPTDQPVAEGAAPGAVEGPRDANPNPDQAPAVDPAPAVADPAPVVTDPNQSPAVAN